MLYAVVYGNLCKYRNLKFASFRRSIVAVAFGLTVQPSGYRPISLVAGHQSNKLSSLVERNGFLRFISSVCF